MSYTTKWELLNAKKEVVHTFQRICFSNHTDTPFHVNDHYFRYKFDNAVVSDEEMDKYFRFIKATPEFKHLMPRSIKQMVKDKTYTYDLTTGNGSQLFGILSLLRAVVEDPLIVRSVIRFDHKRKHAWSHLAIIKAAGSQHQQNSNHWITGRVSQPNLERGINDMDRWGSEIPAHETGLVSGLFDVFQWPGDGYYAADPIPAGWGNKMLDAQRRKNDAKKADIVAKRAKVIRPIFDVQEDHRVFVTGDVLDLGIKSFNRMEQPAF